MKVCRVCLTMGVKMYHMSEHNLSVAYERVTGIELNMEEKLPKMLCWECAARLSSAHNFMKKALKTHLILANKMKSSKFMTMRDIEFIDKTQLKSTLGVKFYKDNCSYIHIIENGNYDEDNKAELYESNYDNINNLTHNFPMQHIVSAENDPIKGEYSVETEEENFEEYNTETDIRNESDEFKFQNSDEELVIDNEIIASRMSEEGNHIMDETTEVYDHTKQNWKRKRGEALPHCKELRVVLEDIMLILEKQKTQDHINILKDNTQSTKDNNENFSQGTIDEKNLFYDENLTCSKNTVGVSKYIDTTCENSSISDSDYNKISATHDDAVSSSKLLICDSTPQLQNETSLMKNIQKDENYTNKISISKHTNSSTSVKSRLKYHTNTKHHKSSFNCAHCDFVTNFKGRLVKHINYKHTKNITFNCSYCTYGTNIKPNLIRHINVKHTKFNVFKCTFCDYKAYDKVTFTRHVNAKHTKTNVFNCSFCNYKTYDKRYLKLHINSQHTKTDAFNCSLCDYKTYDKRYIKEHINSQHTKTIVFSCSLCDYKCYYNKDLKRHINAKHTKVNVFICSYCNLQVYYKENLRTHIKAKHS